MATARVLVPALALAILACADPGPGNALPAGSGQLLTILNYESRPRSLAVRPGSVVQIHNQDAVVHSVTSAATPGSYTPGAVAGISFDTGPFTGTWTIDIPASAPPGAVIPYYCTIHGAAEVTQGELVISAP